MDKKIIASAIESAINILSNELETVEYEPLKEEYEQTLVELEKALEELNK